MAARWSSHRGRSGHTRGCLNWKVAATSRSGLMTCAYMSLHTQMTGRHSGWTFFALRGCLAVLSSPSAALPPEPATQDALACSTWTLLWTQLGQSSG